MSSRLPLLLAITLLGQAGVSYAQAPAAQPAPPEKLAELQKIPGLTALNGEELAGFDGFPVTAVFRRNSGNNEINYLVFRDTVVAYKFDFRQSGDGSDLWDKSISSFLESAFPRERFAVGDSSATANADGFIHRRVLVKRIPAYENATRDYLQAEAERLRGVAFGSESGTPAVEASPAPTAPTSTKYPKTLDEFLKRFSSVEKVDPVEGSIAGFSNASADLPANGYYLLRKSESAELLVLCSGQQIIGYLAKVTSPPGAGSLWQSAVEAGLDAAFPRTAFSRRLVDNLSTGNQICYIYEIRDNAAFSAARETRVAEEAAKWQSLLNP